MRHYKQQNRYMRTMKYRHKQTRKFWNSLADQIRMKLDQHTIKYEPLLVGMDNPNSFINNYIYNKPTFHIPNDIIIVDGRI